MGFTARQEAFIAEFLKCRNAAEAARRAGYSEARARQQGHILVTNRDIAEEIKRRTQEKIMADDEVLAGFADQARATMEDFISFNVAPYPTFTLDLDKARRRGKLHLIKKLKYNSDGQPEIEILDAHEARVAIARCLGLFIDKSESTVHLDPGFTADDLAEAQARLTAWKKKNAESEKSNG